MDRRGTPPGRSEARYEELTGGPEGRLTLYLARRYFNLSKTEWDDLPWWETRALIEGLHAEGILKKPGENDDPAEPVPTGTAPVVDLTGPLPAPIKGFTTRRAG